VEWRQGRGREDPPRLPAVFENPTGIRSGLAWGFPRAFIVWQTPPPPAKRPLQFAEAHASGNRGVCVEQGRHDSLPPRGLLIRPCVRGGTVGFTCGGCSAMPTALGGGGGGKKPAVFLRHAHSLPRTRFRSGRAKFQFRPSARGADRVVFLSDRGRARPLPPMRNLRRLAPMGTLGFPQPLPGV